MLQRYSAEKIYGDLHSLGIKKGDILLLKVNVLSTGLICNDPKSGFLNCLLEYLGPNGTIAAPAYTTSYFLPFFNRKKKIFSTRDAPNTGAFAKSMLIHPDSLRSIHPTNSFVAIGKYAKEILCDHDDQSHSYQPVRNLIELGAKGLIVGCLDSNPGHLTAHLAQYDLDQSTKNIFKGLSGACFYKNGELKVFLRKDFGGHASGAIKFHDYYDQNGAIEYGKVGNADSGISLLRDSYEIEKYIFQKDAKFMLCSDPLCFSCRATWRYNLGDIPRYVLRKLIYFVKNKVKQNET